MTCKAEIMSFDKNRYIITCCFKLLWPTDVILKYLTFRLNVNVCDETFHNVNPYYFHSSKFMKKT